MITHFKLALIGATACMVAQYAPNLSASSNKQPDVISQIIDAHESDMINKKAFDNVMRAMGQPQE